MTETPKLTTAVGEEPLPDPELDSELPETSGADTDPDFALRIACLQFAQTFCTQETPLTDFLEKAESIEKFVRTGKQPNKES